MAQVIARVYATEDKAASAVKEVKGLGYGDSEVFACSPSASASKGDYAASLIQAGMEKAEADAVADDVVKGRSVVIVHAAFGGGVKASAALDKFAPIAAPAVKPAKAVAAPKRKLSSPSRGPIFTGETRLEEATPLSTYMNWPTLLSGATPFSDFFKFSVLSDWSFTKVKLSDNAAPLSKKMGWEVLKEGAAPFSTKLNLRVLKD
jgi:hypothetical protein